MGYQKKSEKRVGRSHLQLATIDGAFLPTLQLSLYQREGPTPTKKSFFQQLLLDFAFACELYYPVQQYERFAMEEEDSRDAQPQFESIHAANSRTSRLTPKIQEPRNP
ncbi:hypothetical protein ACFSQT_03950 [Mesorhizobium calcicola]|uniref:Transposase n=1 Tax=Mesorhizobium calcicola TaxID=1300310 RepID=A0ABW4W955_9HYPH